MSTLYVLFESASGYGLFEVVEAEQIGNLKAEVQRAVTDASRFGQIVKLKGFQPFQTHEDALANVLAVSEGELHETLKAFLELNLPRVKTGKTPKFRLGVQDSGIGSAIQRELLFPCVTDDSVNEIVRGVRMHLEHYVQQLDRALLKQAQLGLGHSFSRAKVKFNVNRADNMIIQAICLLDQLDKDINTFAMRLREWYAYHFPELFQIVQDNFVYARLATFIQDRTTIMADDSDKLEGLREIIMDEDKADAVVQAARTSMGMEMSEIDMINIVAFTDRLVDLNRFRAELHEYLQSKMATVAPNLAALIGEMVGARLISHAGSLTSLAKLPASTVQIIGAEKALFRALKNKPRNGQAAQTPKFGLLYHAGAISRASSKNKGRISRYLANKCSIASRIDAFSDEVSPAYGEQLREQVDERLAFYETGTTPRKNIDVMQGVAASLRDAAGGAMEVDSDSDAPVAPKSAKKKSKKVKKRKLSDASDAAEEVAAAAVAVETPKKAKKAKKSKTAETPVQTPVAAAAPVSAKKSSKKKKKKSSA